jgi:hypothetical protein
MRFILDNRFYREQTVATGLPWEPRNRSPSAPKQISDPPLHQMVRAIVDRVAARAQALEIALPVVAWIVNEVCSSQDHAGCAAFSGAVLIRH